MLELRRYLLLLPIVAACTGNDGAHTLTCSELSGDPSVGKPCLSFVSEEFDGCLLGSPIEYRGPDGSQIIVVSGDGRVAAIAPGTGHTLWSVDLPERPKQMAYVVATPTLIDDHRLAVAWQDVPADAEKPANEARSSHRVAVVDLERGALDDDFPVVELAGSAPAADGGVIDFNPEYALSRASLVHAGGDPGRGYVYVSFGNWRDIQPYHGFVFELDLDAWHDRGADSAISAVLATTSETDCGKAGHSGSFEMICGGGVWSPAGPEVVGTDDGFEIVIPTGNGVLDPMRRDYGHTLMRVRGPGLAFDDGCDPAACSVWDVDAPSPDCMQSCQNLFIPRFPDGVSMLDVKSCEGLSFFGCYTSLDWDLGADSPAVVDVPDGPRVVLMPAKDGSLYLADFEKLGTLYDRAQLANTCGSHGGSCKMNYTGMMMTRPETTTIDGQLLAVVSTFESDKTNPAGLVGVRVTLHDGTPALERAWEAPRFDSDEAVSAFRTRPSRVRLFDWHGEMHAAVVDVSASDSPGTLYIVRVADGKIRARQKLQGKGQRFAQPLAVGGRIFVNSCVDGNAGPGRLESYRVQ
jgi:hypothetical protein